MTAPLRQSPPHNAEAEAALLGALLVHNPSVDKVADFLKPEHFAEGVHGRIYAAILAAVGAGRVANPVTLRRLFEQDEALAAIGGGRYLARLAADMVSLANTEDYGRQIVDLSKRRRLIALADQIATDAAAEMLDRRADDVIRDAAKTLDAIAEDEATAAACVSAADAAHQAITIASEAHQRGGAIVGVTTGLADLDRLLGGMRNGHLDVLAGRPSMGKTLLADAIAVAAARQFLGDGSGRVVLEFQLEMTSAELGARRLAAATGIACEQIDAGRLTREDFARLVAARDELHQFPLFTDDTPSLALADIRMRARRTARKRRLGLVVVDHIGLVRGAPETRRNGETAVITEITVGLKALAKDLQCPVLALSQLNRDVEKRDDKRPTLADLRQSGSIEQDADVVIFIYREEYYLARERPIERNPREKQEDFDGRRADQQSKIDRARNRAQLVIAKHRNGPIGEVEAFFDGAFGVIKNLSQGELRYG